MSHGSQSPVVSEMDQITVNAQTFELHETVTPEGVMVYADVTIKYADENDPAGWRRIAIGCEFPDDDEMSSELQAWDSNIFYYCGSVDEFESLVENGNETDEWMIVPD